MKIKRRSGGINRQHENVTSFTAARGVAWRASEKGGGGNLKGGGVMGGISTKNGGSSRQKRRKTWRVTACLSRRRRHAGEGGGNRHHILGMAYQTVAYVAHMARLAGNNGAIFAYHASRALCIYQTP